MKENETELYEHLRTIGAGDGSVDDIARTALILASLDRPGVSFQKYEHHLEILCLDLASEKMDSDTAADRAKTLSAVLQGRHEYSGNQEYYDDLQNANLMSVIDTRKGLPVTLSILYMHVARSQGWQIEGINFPGHFLIRLNGSSSSMDGQVIIDPYHDGKIVNARDMREMLKKSSSEFSDLRPEYYEAITDRDILVRLLNNIKIRCLKVSDLGQAINILSRLVMIDPKDIQHHYELGMLLAHIKKNELAKESLHYCLSHIDKFYQNDLIEQQIINTLQDIENQEAQSRTSNVLKMPTPNE